MALFTLSDIKFNGNDVRGPLNKLVESQYQQNNKKYPIDLGSTNQGHYMVFYINVQEKTQFTSEAAKGSSPTILSNLNSLQSQRGITSLSQAGQAIREVGSSALSGVSSAINSIFGNANSNGALSAQQDSQIKAEQAKRDLELKTVKTGNLFRNIKRIKDTVALYMPDTLNFTYNQQFSDVSLTNTFGAVGTAISAGIAAADDLKGKGQNTGGNLSAFALKGATSLAGAAGDVAFTALSGGLVSNPQLELIYSTPSFRSFRFQFMMYPRSEKEAQEVLDIINLLKFHQAPEILSRTAGRFLIPPSEFDIKFYYNGVENPNIPKISTCVLESIDADYAPNGFAAYEVPGENTPSKGKTGMPVAIRLDLQFKETEILTKDSYVAAKDGGVY
jgi:hypothetical protein